MSGAFTLLAAGPPRLANIGSLTFAGSNLSTGAGNDIVFPMGVVQNFNLSHTRQFSRIFEVGSERSFFISGRTFGQVGLSRVLYSGPSLLRVIYAYYQDLFPPTLVPSVIGSNNIGALTVANAHNVKIPPGYENLYLNLASDLFAQPVGLMAYFRDSNEDTVGAIYMESCYIPNHTIATDSQGTIIQESVGVQFERAVPVAVSALALVDLSASDNALGLS